MLVIVSIITAAFAPIIIQYYYDKSKKENKEHLQRIAIFSVYGGILFTLVLHAAGVPIEERISSLFDSSSAEVADETMTPFKRLTLEEATLLASKHAEGAGQTLMKSKTQTFNGSKLFTFMSVAQNGWVCIFSIADYSEDILGINCGPSESQMDAWNS